MEHKKCFLCLKECLPKEKFNINRKKAKAAKTDKQATNDDVDPVKNQMQVVFLLRKILELPEERCCAFLQDYGDPCSWIDYCNSCSTLVEKAKGVFDKILKLQDQYKSLQNEIINKLSISEGKTGPKLGIRNIVRSHVSQSQELSDDSIHTTSNDKIGEDTCFSNVTTTAEDSNCSVQNQGRRSESAQNISGGEDHPHHLNGMSKADENESEVQDPLKLDGIGETLSCFINPYDIQKEEPGDFADGVSENTIENEESESNSRNTSSKRSKGRSVRYSKGVSVTSSTETVSCQYPCDVCWQRCTNIYELKDHLQSHTSKLPHECHFCGKLFALVDNLNVHVKSHNDRDSYKYKCQFCGRSFKEKCNLTIHVRIHTGEKPYGCEFCDKSFAHHSTLKNHIRTHTGEKFKCDMCKKCFSRVGILKTHLKKCHKNVNLN